MFRATNTQKLSWKGHDIWFEVDSEEEDEEEKAAASLPGYIDRQADLAEVGSQKYSEAVKGEHIVGPSSYRKMRDHGYLLHNPSFRPVVSRWLGDRRMLVLRSPWLERDNIKMGRTTLTWIEMFGGGWSDCLYLRPIVSTSSDTAATKRTQVLLRRYLQMLRSLTHTYDKDREMDMELGKYAKAGVVDAATSWFNDIKDVRNIRISVVLEMDDGGCTRAHVSSCDIRTPPTT